MFSVLQLQISASFSVFSCKLVGLLFQTDTKHY